MNNYYEKFSGLKSDDLIMELNKDLEQACVNSDFDKIKYLLTSPDLESHADIHYKKDTALNLAVFDNKIEIVKYLLTAPELKEHADIHADHDNAFIIAAYYNHMDIVNYFIFDLNIEKTESIKKELADTPKIEQKINKNFELRELNKELNNELSFKDNNQQKKVKI